MLINNNAYFLIKDDYSGLYLKAENDLRCDGFSYSWVEKRSATPFLNISSNNRILTSKGLLASGKSKLLCNENGSLS